MKTKIIAFIVVIISTIFTTCAPFGIGDLNTAKVNLNTGINPAASRAAQSDVASFKLTVTAADMTAVEQVFTGESVSLELEAGPARTFTLQALDANANVLFSGSTTADLTAGESTNISIQLGYAGFYVTFNTNGGTALPVQYVESGGLVSIPSPPVKTDYILIGWYTDVGLSTVWNPGVDTVGSDLTLYAAWTIADSVAPSAGGSGLLTFSSVTDTTLTLNWTAATDDTTAQANLVYDVYRSENSSEVNTLLNCLSNTLNRVATGLTAAESYSDSGLTAETTYYYNVIVIDEAGNREVYVMNSQATTATIIANLFSDDFSTDGSLDGSAPDIGSNWSVTSGTLDVSGGVVDTSLTTGATAFAGFSTALSSGQTLYMTFTTENLSTAGDFNNTSWAGISLYTSATERIFIGNVGSDYGWGIGGPAVSIGAGALSGPVVAAAQTVEFSYEYDTGSWTLDVGGSTASGTATTGLAIDRLRIAADDAGIGDIAFSSITVGASDEFVYVASTGNDSVGFGTPDSPFATIQKGIDEASARGSTEVRVAGGTYTTTATITLADGVAVLGGYNSADWSRDISANVTTINSSPTGSPDRVFYALSLSDPASKVDGFTINATLDYDGSYVFDISSSSVTVSNNIVNTSNSDWHSYHLRASNSTINVNKNQFNCIAFGANYSGGIYISSSGTAVITNNIIETEYSGSESGGIYTDFSGTYDLTIRNNIIDAGYTFQGGAIGTKAVANLSTSSAVLTLRVDNNIITTDNTASEFYVLYSASPNITIESFKNNAVYTPGTIAFSGIYRNAESTDDGGGDDTIYSDISSFETAFINAEGNISFTAVDLFTDSANKDFTFGAGAATAVTAGGIDGSAAGWSFSDDINAVTRTGNGTTGWSMGAYEQD